MSVGQVVLCFYQCNVCAHREHYGIVFGMYILVFMFIVFVFNESLHNFSSIYHACLEPNPPYIVIFVRKFCNFHFWNVWTTILLEFTFLHYQALLACNNSFHVCPVGDFIIYI